MSKLGITSSQTVGPFLTIALQKEGQEYVVPDTREGAIKVHGYVFDGDGQPVPDAVIEIWQANIFGKYDHPEDTSQANLVEDFSGFGRSCTDTDGYFFFVTLKPGRVVGLGNALQAPHVAVNVLARGMLKQQATRIYFSDEKAANSEDPVLAKIEDENIRNTIIAKLTKNKGVPTYSFDIHLQGEKETVFFDL